MSRAVCVSAARRMNTAPYVVLQQLLRVGAVFVRAALGPNCQGTAPRNCSTVNIHTVPIVDHTLALAMSTNITLDYSLAEARWGTHSCTFILNISLLENSDFVGVS